MRQVRGLLTKYGRVAALASLLSCLSPGRLEPAQPADETRSSREPLVAACPAGHVCSTVYLDPVADTDLVSTSPNQNFGSGVTLRPDASGPRVSVVHFDTVAMAEAVGARTLLRAAVEIPLIEAVPGTVGAHRMTVGWGEPGATWNCASDVDTSNDVADCSQAWDLSGATAPPWITTPTSSATLTATTELAVFDVTSDVTLFLAPQPTPKNRGWALRVAGATGAMKFWGRESASRPRLVLELAEPVSLAAPPLDMTVVTSAYTAGRFLYHDADASATVVQRLPSGARIDPSSIEEARAAIVRGRVLDAAGAPLAGVTVSIRGAAGLGVVTTRADGRYDMAVNGVGPLVVRFAASGRLPIDRQVEVPPRSYAVLPDVVMLAPEAAQHVDLTLPDVQVARGSVVTDDSGTRRATLLLAEDTTACGRATAGGTCVPLASLDIRLTEYTVGPLGPERMPASLQPNVAYTYAVELGVDGYETIEFAGSPVSFYVENFLQYPVGIAVPMGSYDRARAEWVASENGRVIRVTGVTAGVAEVDIDGDGVPNTPTQLDAFGLPEAERRQLATTYGGAVPVELWRVPITHFSTWDCNWPFAPPTTAVSPNRPAPEGDRPYDCSTIESGSIIECENQILGERLAVPGTPYTLDYRSDRTPGRLTGNTYNISLVGDSVPVGVTAVELRVTVVGRETELTFAPAPNLSYRWSWDGRDAYGRLVQGRQPIAIEIGYTYPGVPREASRFGAPGGGAITGSATRRTVTLWQRFTIVGGTFHEAGRGLGGWSVSAHHVYDPYTRIVYLGDGSRITEPRAGQVLEDVAGSVIGTASDDDVPALSLLFNQPHDVAYGPDRSVYAADTFNNRVRRVRPNGIASVVRCGSDPAFLQPESIAFGADGSLYVAEYAVQRVRRVAPDGTCSTVAGGVGNDPYAPSHEGQPATSVPVDPTAIAVAPDGTLFISEGARHRVRRVGTDGRITTIAGTGVAADPFPDPTATSVPATGAGAAAISSPQGLALTERGEVVFVLGGTQRVVRLGNDGRLYRVAGTGVSTGPLGDFGPATSATLRAPRDVAIDVDGTIYVSDAGDHRIRRIDPSGTITTIAGTGTAGIEGNGGPASAAQLHAPYGLAVGRDGALYLSETLNNRVRRVRPVLPGAGLSVVVIPGAGGAELYHFDSSGRHNQTTDALTGRVLRSFGYDVSNRLLTSIVERGRTTTIERDGSGVPTAIVGPDGIRTALRIDPTTSMLTGIRYPGTAAPAWTVAFDYHGATGLLHHMTDARGGVYTFTYDPLGRLRSDADPTGATQRLARGETLTGFVVEHDTAEGRRTRYTSADEGTDHRRTVTGPDGLASSTVRDASWVETITEPDGTVTTITPRPDPRFGMLAPLAAQTVTIPRAGMTPLTGTVSTTRQNTYTDPFDVLTLATQTDVTTVGAIGGMGGESYTTTFTRGTVTSTIRTVAPSQVWSNVVVDTVTARVTRIEQPRVGPVTFQYRVDGRIESLEQDTRRYEFAYHPDGRLWTVTDPASRVTSYAYFPDGRVREQTLPGGAVVAFTYDANGNVASITPPGRPAHAMQHFANDLLEVYTAPVVGTVPRATTYAHNRDRQPRTVTRPGGALIDLAYDTAGRLQTVQWPTGTVTRSYHTTTGHLSTLTGLGTTLTYAYDGSLPTSETWSGAVSGGVSWSYQNGTLRPEAQRVNGVDPVTYAYTNGLLTGVGAMSITRDVPPHVAATVATGAIVETALGVVTTTRAVPNVRGEVTEESASITGGGSPIFRRVYGYDVLGRIESVAETLEGTTTTTTYEYDVRGRLWRVRRGGTLVATYGYDANGNRTSYTDETTGVVTTGVPDDQDRLTSYGATTFVYAADGSLRERDEGTQVTTYDYDALGNLRSVTLPDTSTIEYVVDGRNRRIGRRVGASEQRFLYDGQLRIVAELDATNAVVSRFVYGTRANAPDYVVQGGVTYRVLTDHLGSPRLVVNTATGAIVQRMRFDEWGRVLEDTVAPGFQRLPFGFAGGLYDRDTGLVRFGARDYDARTGRWTAKDPIGFGGGDANLYAYVGDEPVNLADPRGTDVVVIWGGSVPGNPFGHVAIGVQGRGIFSFGTATPLGSSVTDYLAGEVARRTVRVVVIPTVPAQDRAVLQRLQRYAPIAENLRQPGRGTLSPWGADNCATRTSDALDAIMPNGLEWDAYPREVYARSMYAPGAQYFYFDRGSRDDLSQFRRFNP